MQLYLTGHFLVKSEIENLFGLDLEEKTYFVMRLSSSLAYNSINSKTLFFGALVNCSKRLRGEFVPQHYSLSDYHLVIPLSSVKKKGGCLYLGTLFKEIIKGGRNVFICSKNKKERVKAKIKIREDFQKFLSKEEQEKEKKTNVHKSLLNEYVREHFKVRKSLPNVIWGRDEKILKKVIKEFGEKWIDSSRHFFALEDNRPKSVPSFLKFMRELKDRNIELDESLVVCSNRFGVHSYLGYLKIQELLQKDKSLTKRFAYSYSLKKKKFEEKYGNIFNFLLNVQNLDSITEAMKEMCDYKGNVLTETKLLQSCGCSLCLDALRIKKFEVDVYGLAKKIFKDKPDDYISDLTSILELKERTRNETLSLLLETKLKAKIKLYGKGFLDDLNMLSKEMKRSINGLGY